MFIHVLTNWLWSAPLSIFSMFLLSTHTQEVALRETASVQTKGTVSQCSKLPLRRGLRGARFWKKIREVTKIICHYYNFVPQFSPSAWSNTAHTKSPESHTKSLESSHFGHLCLSPAAAVIKLACATAPLRPASASAPIITWTGTSSTSSPIPSQFLHSPETFFILPLSPLSCSPSLSKGIKLPKRISDLPRPLWVTKARSWISAPGLRFPLEKMQSFWLYSSENERANFADFFKGRICLQVSLNLHNQGILKMQATFKWQFFRVSPLFFLNGNIIYIL